MFLQAFQHLLQVGQVFSLSLPRNQDVINIAYHLGNALKYGVHGALEHRRCGGYTKWKTSELEKSLVCINRNQLLGLCIK